MRLNKIAIFISCFLFLSIVNTFGQNEGVRFKLIEKKSINKNPLFDYKDELVESYKRMPGIGCTIKGEYDDILLTNGKSLRIEQFSHIAINLEKDRIVTLVKRKIMFKNVVEHFFLIIYNSNGDIIFESKDPVSSYYIANIKISKNGNIYMTGTKIQKERTGIVFQKFDINGKIIWVKVVSDLWIILFDISEDDEILVVLQKGRKLSQNKRYFKGNYTLTILNLNGDKIFEKEMEGYFRKIEFSRQNDNIYVYSVYDFMTINLNENKAELKHTNYISENEKVISLGIINELLVCMNYDKMSLEVLTFTDDDPERSEFLISNLMLDSEKMRLRLINRLDKYYLLVHTDSKEYTFEIE